MASDEEQLVLSISADTRQIMNAIKRLEKAVGASAGQLEKSFSGVGKGIDKSFGTSVQKRINEITGVGTKATKEWAGALADQGKELERMRSRFNPIFSTISRYKATVGEIQTAHRLGAISADEMAAAISRERQATLASIAAIKGRNAAIADTPVVAGGRGVNNFNTANIAAQFQDIAVMAQMGIANPLTIALQQGTQLAAVFNQMGGTKDVIRGIGAAFLSIINPISLVTVGTIAAGVAAYNYFAKTEDGAANTEKALKEQIDLIDSIAKKWGDALPMVRAYADEQDRLAGKADSAVAFKKLADDTFGKIKEEVSSAGDSIQAVMGLLQQTIPTDQIVAVSRSLNAVSDSASKNKTTVEELDIAHKALMDAFHSNNIPILKDAADAIAALRPELADVTDELQRLAAERTVKDMFNELQAAIGNISSAKAREELRTLMDQAKSGEISVADLLAELGRISGYAPDVSSIISAFRAVAEAANAARAAGAAVTGKESQGGRTRYHSGAFMQLPGGNAPTPTDAPNREDVAAENDRRAAAAARRGSGSRAPQRTADDRFFEDIEAIRQRTIALAEEAKMVGMGYEAQTKRKIAFDLEQKALKDVREEARKKGDQDWQNAQLTPDQVAEIDRASDAYAKQAENLRLVREAQAEYEDWMNLGRDATRGFIQDLIDGKSAGEAFANVLGKIGDKLLDMAMNDLWGNGSGGGGLLGSLFGGLLGGGGGGGIPWSQDTFRANGGPVQAGKAYIVGEKRPELFVPNQSGTIVPQVPVMPKLAAGGATTSSPQQITIRVDVSGARGNAEIMDMVQKGVHQGLTLFDQQVLPGRVNQIAADPHAVG